MDMLHVDHHWKKFYSKPLVEYLLELGHVIDIQSILKREITNSDFENLMLQIVNLSSFDEISFYVSIWWSEFFKKSFFKWYSTDWNKAIKLSLLSGINEQDNTNLYKVVNGTQERTRFWYKVSRIPTPWVWDDFVIELYEWVYIAGDNYEKAEDVNSYLDIIELLSMAISQILKQWKLIDELLRDELTKLYNRKCWNRDSFEDGYIVAVDIDNFKSVNDSYWHDVWDDVLKQIAWAIQHNIRIEDKAYRLGGEEFRIYIKEKVENLAIKIADRVRTKVASLLFDHNPLVTEKSWIIIPKRFWRTISMWVAKIINWEKQEALKVADQRLYVAKTTWKNKIVNE